MKKKHFIEFQINFDLREFVLFQLSQQDIAYENEYE